MQKLDNKKVKESKKVKNKTNYKSEMIHKMIENSNNFYLIHIF
jgi:hypothetical protein